MMKNKNVYQWVTASLKNNDLIFIEEDGFERAIEDGFFFIKVPDDIDFIGGDLFANEFYKMKTGDIVDNYRGFHTWTSSNLAPREGYFVRTDDQVEQFFLEKQFWAKVFPEELRILAERMQFFGLLVLESVLKSIDLPVELWDEATGRSLSGRGAYHLTFNHFRPSVQARGLNVHKDSGWLTILRSIDPGLEVLRKGEWVPINPKADHFIVNFGCAIEILSHKMKKKVSAVSHRVTQQTENGNTNDRFSYALFIDSSFDETVCQGLYSYSDNNSLIKEKELASFIDDIVNRTYQRDGDGLY
ncbi:2OG-Fe(II) oxygenase family protein [Sodalis sp. RH21]|uniref:2OG-Fe(II) oxygenase family protein n=1 Tax=unclassified Sodalis (in: enterobacteria) TaxID=2636512 RepID=UPI0039B55A77